MALKKGLRSLILREARGQVCELLWGDHGGKKLRSPTNAQQVTAAFGQQSSRRASSETEPPASDVSIQMTGDSSPGQHLTCSFMKGPEPKPPC